MGKAQGRVERWGSSTGDIGHDTHAPEQRATSCMDLTLKSTICDTCMNSIFAIYQ